eukprot:CAMPEP_0203675304 /NCGR_PEP_ID=MMETSP0090-20130426/19775_1 /ASSEMBLY_ACC=CAM_ASM_001088 /TAXON_ID=426623 /ORGANISM="Chaetoceros affinis, Strain CCMP159" /LENGTH=391 /DNA_ID=CAMNT_0050541457 /DNA_START=121 /DNA_END=1296 /DNA_ORIENTATION=-
MRGIPVLTIFLPIVLSYVAAFVPTATTSRNTVQDVSRRPSLLLPSPSSSPFSSTTELFSTTASSSTLFINGDNELKDKKAMNALTGTSTSDKMHPLKAGITKAGMVSFIVSMCIALPTTLFPVKLLHRAKLISTLQKEQISCRIGCFCSRWLMRVIPFARVKVMKNDEGSSDSKEEKPEPTIWVCNHTSMLDIFFLLAKDKKLRGKNKRPIKIIYWKDLEKNPVTKVLFTMSGFIPVEMEDNGNGNANTYNKSSFKALLKSVKKAFDDGFDIGILPEGQLNPCPEKGLQPSFGGAFTLARMSKRPIKMMAIHGLHKLWHGDDKIGMTVTGRKVKMRNYNLGGKFKDSNEFIQAFENVVGHFGATGQDNPSWRDWSLGSSALKNGEADGAKK